MVINLILCQLEIAFFFESVSDKTDSTDIQFRIDLRCTVWGNSSATVTAGIGIRVGKNTIEYTASDSSFIVNGSKVSRFPNGACILKNGNNTEGVILIESTTKFHVMAAFGAWVTVTNQNRAYVDYTLLISRNHALRGGLSIIGNSLLGYDRQIVQAKGLFTTVIPVTCGPLRIYQPEEQIVFTKDRKDEEKNVLDFPTVIEDPEIEKEKMESFSKAFPEYKDLQEDFKKQLAYDYSVFKGTMSHNELKQVVDHSSEKIKIFQKAAQEYDSKDEKRKIERIKILEVILKHQIPIHSVDTLEIRIKKLELEILPKIYQTDAKGSLSKRCASLETFLKITHPEFNYKELPSLETRVSNIEKIKK